MARPHHGKRVLGWASYSLFAVSAGLLGLVAYTKLDSSLFQAYENRKLDRELLGLRTPPSPVTLASTVLPTSLPGDEAAPANIGPGDMIGRIEISRLKMAVIVLEGTSGKTLRRAVGHIAGTALPGSKGNVGIAGHRDTFFSELRDIRKGDEIKLTTVGGIYAYNVDSIRIVDPEDIGVLKDSGGSVVTLVTCYPFDFVGPAPKRFIVRARGERQ